MDYNNLSDDQFNMLIETNPEIFLFPIDKKSEYPFHIIKDTNRLKRIIEIKPSIIYSPNSEYKNILYLAIKNNNIELIKYILEIDEKLYTRNNICEQCTPFNEYPFHEACLNGDYEIIKLIYSKFHNAIRFNSTCELLLYSKNPNICNSINYLIKKNPKIVEYKLKNGKTFIENFINIFIFSH
jgi:ankyrin repeat protein